MKINRMQIIAWILSFMMVFSFVFDNMSIKAVANSDSLLSGEQKIQLEEASSGIYWWILGMVVVLGIAGLIGFIIYRREEEEDEV